MAHAIVPGTTLGKCEIVRELGHGGMGTVYLARHRTLDVPVAVKVLSPEVARISPMAAERFLREARLTARIRHPNLVAVMDTDTDPVTGCAYLIMEFVEGPSAAALITAGPMKAAEAVRVGLGVARALEAAAQQNVIHRDIKPANVLVAADGTVKLTDLGLAKDTELDARLTNSAATLGTPLYMSPEQIKHRELDVRCDIYALGVTIYELLTGLPPYNGLSFYEIADQITQGAVPDPRERDPEIDARLAAIVMQMMAKSPDDRPATPTEVAALLGGWLGEVPGVDSAVRLGTVAPLRVSSSGVNIPTLGDAAAASKAASPTPPLASRAGRSVLLACAAAVVSVAALLIVRPELFRVSGGHPESWMTGVVPQATTDRRGPPPGPPGWRAEWGPPPPPPGGMPFHPSGWRDGDPFPPGYENTTWRPGDAAPPPWDVDAMRGQFPRASSSPR